MTLGERRRLESILLDNLKREQTALRILLAECNDPWCYEDGIYRFYHQSFKVFDLQSATQRMVDALSRLAPEGRAFCDFFRHIVAGGTGRQFSLEDNAKWAERAAPIVQAFLHARYFIEMATKYVSEFDEPPQVLPSGWAAILELYDIR